MRASDEARTEVVSLRKQPGETRAQFIERVRLARGPLTQTEIAQLRKIFAPGPPPAAAPQPSPRRTRPLREAA